ncbi:MAG TPA: hypothetical protein VJ917_09830 [Saprospiraceae bacterium]|nr:hypothetical protein [Saprospiraceae bacterium]
MSSGEISNIESLFEAKSNSMEDGICCRAFDVPASTALPVELFLTLAEFLVSTFGTLKTMLPFDFCEHF